MIAKSVTRVVKHSPVRFNQRIQERIADNITYYASHPREIDARLEDLDEEWDIERVLETGSSSISLIGVLLGFKFSKKWFLLTAGVQGFFLQHALHGWCPPLPILRKLGFRTVDEINEERIALKGLRGDFDDLPTKAEVRAEGSKSILEAVI